jgi:RNA polymerase sigma factor (sigma-70 family)
LNQEKLAETLEKLKKCPSSPDYWEELYLIVWPLLMAKMYRRTAGNRYLAQESSQETMLRILRYFDFTRSDVTASQFLKYLSITSNSVLVDLIRVRNREFAVMASSGDIESLSDTPDFSPNPEERAVVQAAMDGLIRRLSPREGELIYLLMQGKTTAEIASSMGIDEKTVGNTIAKVRVKCRKELFGH